MNIRLKSKGIGLLLSLAAAVGMTAIAGSADASVTLYTSQSAFNAAAPAASTFGFNAGGAISVAPNPLASHGLSFKDDLTAADILNGGVPLLFLIDAADNPTYGQDFLSYQNNLFGNLAEIDSAGTSAIGFSYGSYIPTGDATVTLNTGDSFLISPSSTPAFIGFISTSRITSVLIDYPASFDLDLLSVSSVSAAVPELSTWAMMLIGFGGLGAMARSRRRRAVAVA